MLNPLQFFRGSCYEVTCAAGFCRAVTQRIIFRLLDTRYNVARVVWAGQAPRDTRPERPDITAPYTAKTTEAMLRSRFSTNL